MAQVTIYLPDGLRDRIKTAGLNVSAICRTALEHAADAEAETRRQELAQAAGVNPGCTSGRHIGNKKRLSYGNVCDACGRTWEQ
jgi:hypothetical protein